MKNTAYVIINNIIEIVKIIDSFKDSAVYIDKDNSIVHVEHEVIVIQYKDGRKDVCNKEDLFKSKKEALTTQFEDEKKYLKEIIENKNRQLKYINELQKNIKSINNKIKKLEKQLKKIK